MIYLTKLTLSNNHSLTRSKISLETTKYYIWSCGGGHLELPIIANIAHLALRKKNIPHLLIKSKLIVTQLPELQLVFSDSSSHALVETYSTVS